MKRLLIAILILCMVCSLAACGSADTVKANTTITTGSVSVSSGTTDDGGNTTSTTEGTTTTETTATETTTTTIIVDSTTTTAKPSTTKKPTTTTTGAVPTTKPINTKKHNLSYANQIEYAISPASLEVVGKELRTYGEMDAELVKELEKALKGYSKNISIAIWSVDGSRGIVYNTKQGFFSACTIKMPVMLSYCKEIDAGKADATKKLTYDSSDYYGGSGEIRYKPYGSKFTIQYLIEQSLCISDNVAYKMLLDEFGKKPNNNLMEGYGCSSLVLPSSTKWAHNATSRDLLIVWSEVYKYFGSGAPSSSWLKNACTNTKWNYGSRVSKYEYSHKSGDCFGDFQACNDAGIVWSEVPYVYAIMTRSENTSYDKKTMDTVMGIVEKLMTE